MKLNSVLDQIAAFVHSVAEIARRTGLSHDAVSTTLRAGTLSRGDRYVPGRKTRPSAA